MSLFCSGPIILIYGNFLYLCPLGFLYFASGYVGLWFILYFWLRWKVLWQKNPRNTLFVIFIVRNNMSKYVFLNLTNISNIYRIRPQQWKIRKISICINTHRYTHTSFHFPCPHFRFLLISFSYMYFMVYSGYILHCKPNSHNSLTLGLHQNKVSA